MSPVCTLQPYNRIGADKRAKGMADAMNRSVLAIVVGGFGTGDTKVASAVSAGTNVRRLSAEDAAIQLAYANKVIIVPADAREGLAEIVASVRTLVSA